MPSDLFLVQKKRLANHELTLTPKAFGANQGNQIRVYSCALVVANPYPCYPCNPWLKNCKLVA